MDWNIVSAISTGSMAVVILITAIFAVFQFREISRSRKVAAFTNLSQFLQQEEIRKARRVLIGMSKKNFESWTREEIEEAEKVCSTYNVAGITVSKKLIEKGLVVNEWRDSIIKCWEAAELMIIAYRRERGVDYWDDFQKLYKMAKEIKQP